MSDITEEQILEGNELIAIFMDCKSVSDFGRVYFRGDFLDQFVNQPFPVFLRNHSLNFHSDWNWLIPVIKKCYNIEAPQKELGWSKADRIQYRINDTDIWNNNIIEVFNSVVEFITWYNSHKK